MNKIKKIVSAILVSSMLAIPSTLNASAISNSASGSASGITFDGQGYTVVMMNLKLNDACGKVSVNSMGTGKGDIYYGAYCCTKGGTKYYYSTFSRAGTHRFNTSTSGTWGVDGKNTKLTKKRENVSVSWDIG